MVLTLNGVRDLFLRVMETGRGFVEERELPQYCLTSEGKHYRFAGKAGPFRRSMCRSLLAMGLNPNRLGSSERDPMQKSENREPNMGGEFA